MEKQKIGLKETVLNDDLFDVVIIGAGVVGCAMARRFVLQGARVALLEKASDILDGASKANSAILHTGFDAPEGSLELHCIKQGYREYLEIHQQMNLPLEKTGAHVVAWNDEEVGLLDGILKKANANGISEIELIDAGELLALEPNISDKAKAALTVPGESLIDPWSAPYAYLRQSLMNGGEVYLNCKVTGGEYDGQHWQLQTSSGCLKSRYVINCAGLHGDQVDAALLGTSSFNITPRKGQFVVFDKAARGLVNSIVLQVPTPRTKGVVVCPTVFGNILVGPTAEDQQSRSDASTDAAAIKTLIAAGVEKFPLLENMTVTAVYAGLRPASEFKDYQISTNAKMGWITVGGIRSTGLSGALGIARHVFELYQQLGSKHSPIANPQVPRANVLAQKGQRDWAEPGHGQIVCHCELVTEREITKALQGPLAAGSLAGLKRQTRATMGRCQGFYCSARLGELTAGHFATPISKEITDE